jgi:hypothetical protein
MPLELDNVTAPKELSTIQQDFQKILSLCLAGYKCDETAPNRIIMNLHKTLCSFLRPNRYAAFHRGEDGGVYLNEWKLPDSFVFRRLFDVGRCAGICFQPGLDLRELKECVKEMEACLRSGASGNPLGIQRNFLRHYYWLPPGRNLFS